MQLSQDKKWYIIQTKTLYEERVKKALDKEIERLSLKDKIFQVVIPVEEVIDIRKNKKYIKKRKFFPGYVFVQMILTDDLYWIIKKIPGISNFLGGENPINMPDDEVEYLMNKMEVLHTEKPKLAVNFVKDDNVRIVEGPFVNFVGIVNEINREKGKLTVMVSIFGRTTPVVVDFLQVEKI